MEYRLTRHAKNRNRQIQATIEELADAIEVPDTHYVQEDGREVAIKAIGRKILKIVYRMEGEVFWIITVVDRNF